MAFEFPVRGEHIVLTQEVRASLLGDFITLPDGVTHYQMEGPPEAPVVVLVHGFSVPYFIWDTTWKALIASGWRLLRYDLFGRGYSDRPLIRNDLSLFTRQLRDLLDALEIQQAAAVLGLSMGGLVAASFSVQYPHRVGRLGLIDPAGYPIEFPLYFNLLKVPGIGELFFSLAGEGLFRRLAGNDFYDPELIDIFINRFVDQMQYKGFRRSLLSTMRSGMLGSGADVYPQVGGMDIPVLLVWGEQDTTVPFAHSQWVCEAIPQAEFYPIADSGHIPHYEQPEKVTPILQRFLNDD